MNQCVCQAAAESSGDWVGFLILIGFLVLFAVGFVIADSQVGEYVD